MVRTQPIIKHRWLVLFVLALASVIFTGCDKGSLGIKTGAIIGYVIDKDTNSPISDVMVRATGSTGNGTENKSTYTSGDGSFCISDASKGNWKLNVEKYGYELPGYGPMGAEEINCSINNGETITLSPIKMVKTTENVKGTLRGYPIDAITGRALTNFTVTQETPYNQRKSKIFETAADFRDTGWTSLEGGNHKYSISATNYKTFVTSESTPGYSPAASYGQEDGISIGKSVANIGTILVEPLTVGVSGTLRNVPGYLLEAKNIIVWAESAGKVVASYTDLNGDASQGTIAYTLTGIPVTAGSVAVKCKAKGYDILTIKSAVSIAQTNPGGIIAGVDVDFVAKAKPITSDLTVILRGTKDEPPDTRSTFLPGETARVRVQVGTQDVVPYVDVISQNFSGEVTISNVITGYPIKVIAVNRNRGFCSGESEEFVIPENTQTYTISFVLNEG